MSNFERTTLTENEIAARWAMFGPPPILSSENKEGYYNLRNACVAYYRPRDDRHWAWIRELVDTQWEILRHLRYRTTAIEQSHRTRMHGIRKKIKQIIEMRKNDLSKLHLQFGDVGHDQVLSLQNQIARLEAKIQEIEQQKPDNIDHCLALENATRFAEKLDKWLKNATARRNILLKILEYFCRHADQGTDLPAARYNEVKQDEAKQIAAPLVVPPDSVIGDIATKDHTVEPAAG